MRLPWALTLDETGNVYITGYFYETVDFNPDPLIVNNLTIQNSFDGFTLKLDAAGNFKWVKQIQGSNAEGGYGIAFHPSGYIYITGYFGAVANFDPGVSNYSLTSSADDIFILKLDLAGNFIWAKKIGGTSTDYGVSIQVDPTGNIYTTGYFIGTTDFNPDPLVTYNLTAVDWFDIYVLKLDPSGNFINAGKMGGPNRDYGIAIDVDANENVYITGYYQGTSDFNPDPVIVFNLTSTSASYDIFVVKLRLPSPLPVELVNFDAECNNETVNIKWSTASETNNDYFILQKSIDMLIWEEVTRISGAGNSNLLLTYSYVEEINTGNTYYRLKQVDYDGQFKIYDPISIICESISNEIVIYPNPTQGNFTIDLGKIYTCVQLNMVNVSGQTVLSKSLKNIQLFSIHIELLTGIYFITINTGDKVSTATLVKE